MIRNAMNTNLRFLLVLIVAAIFGTPAWADGTHGSTFTVKNDSGGQIKVVTYNGNDKDCSAGHKDYYIDSGGERTAKCHGNGTGRCKFIVRKVLWGGVLSTRITDKKTCVDSGSHHPGGIDTVKKGEICTITGRSYNDYNCQ